MALYQNPQPQPFIGGNQPLAPGQGPPSTFVVDTPPKLWDGWQLNLVRLWDPPPPSPFIGGLQLLAPRVLTPILALVPNPPFRHWQRTASYLELIRLWDAPPPQPFIGARQPSAPEVGPPSTLLVDTPPRYRVKLDSTLASWLPPTLPQPQRLNPAQILSVDNPPLIYRVTHNTAVRLWDIPTQWLPIVGGKTSPGIPGQSIDGPPLLYRPTVNPIFDSWQVLQPGTGQRVLPVAPLIFIAADNPPFRTSAYDQTFLVKLWEPTIYLLLRRTLSAWASVTIVNRGTGTGFVPVRFVAANWPSGVMPIMEVDPTMAPSGAVPIREVDENYPSGWVPAFRVAANNPTGFVPCYLV